MTPEFIQQYRFGKIVIEGKTYENDVILLGKEVVPNWWRNRGHRLAKKDLEKIIEFKPDLLIVGKGHSGNMSVPSGLPGELNFKVEKYDTNKAVKVYNDKIKKSNQKISGAFHLTC
ncbi:MAG: hypothetical protein BAJALOKI2v1_170038 [Promethearchaeota archaeon]|nr:MAG: hypothetical protein BAJALOKI2v1_170038 [Candidatus Lokiarchaeota archaeon]